MRPELSEFAAYMESVLAKHDKKKGDSWKQMSFDELLELLLNEVNELRDCKTNTEIKSEITDVANIAMMIWWNTVHSKQKVIQ